MKNIKSEIRYLKGVGPKRAESLARLGITVIEDLLFYLPRRYEDRSIITPLDCTTIGHFYTIRAKIEQMSLYTTKVSRKTVFQMKVFDGTSHIYVVWYNMPFLKRNFSVGEEYYFYAKIERLDKVLMMHPDYEPVSSEDSLNTGRIIPVYPLTADVSQKYLRKTITMAVKEYDECVNDILPDNIRKKRDLIPIKDSVKNAHYPVSFDMLTNAYKRIVFDEFFLLQVALAKKKYGKTQQKQGISHQIHEDALNNFSKLLPFELTEDQMKTIKEISQDMKRPEPMHRLLQGDVGSGKTVVALYAILLSIKNDCQSIMMAPTEILARQHFITISEFLMPLGINVRLLVSDMPKDEKEKLKEEIKTGEVDLVCGTHALIQEDVQYHKMGVIVIDEQHKFGVHQRKALIKKGKNPDVLYMSATPIPRTLALTVYGDLDISLIKGKPSGRARIETLVVDEKKRISVYEFIEEELKKKRQAYIVYPRIEGDENTQIKGVLSEFENLKTKVFPQRKVALLHGKMDALEKSKIMKDYKGKKYDILVSTVVIEVGVDVPNASVMLIEHAERFGLSQMHQLRGRIGRGKHQAYCILMGNPNNDDAQRRLDKMAQTDDGFEIAEDDLQARGPGEFFGSRQHGLPEIRFGNILKDMEIMESAREEAFSIIDEDPNLEFIEHRDIKATLYSRFGKIIG